MKRHPEIITAEWLRAHDACVRAIAEFERMFPNGAKLTRANLTKFYENSGAIAIGLWLAINLFNRAERKAYVNHLGSPLESFLYVYTAAKRKAKKARAK